MARESDLMSRTAKALALFEEAVNPPSVTDNQPGQSNRASQESADLDRYKQRAHPEWRQMLDRHPEGLQHEIIDERGKGDKEDREELKDWRSQPEPVKVPITRELVQKHADVIGQSHPEVLAQTNKRFGLSIKPRKILDKDPSRILRYAQMPAKTAKPSVMVNGEVTWGVGRLLAALHRGDTHLHAWHVTKPEDKDSAE